MSVNIAARRWDSRGFWCRVRYTWAKKALRTAEGGGRRATSPLWRSQVRVLPHAYDRKVNSTLQITHKNTGEGRPKKAGMYHFRQRMNDYWQARCFIERQVCSIFSVETKKTAVFRKMNTAVGATAMVFISPRHDRREFWQRPFPTD